MITCETFGLTRDAIMRHVVAVAPSLPHYFDKSRLRNYEKGLTARGTKRAYGKHADIAGLPLAERKRIIAKRWREAKKANQTA